MFIGGPIATNCATLEQTTLINSNKTYDKKYDKEVQKYLKSLPEITEASINGNQLVVRSKDNNETEKWTYDYYPFYWQEIGTINLENGAYILFRANKKGFAENKYFLNVLKYKNDNSIIGFTDTKILKNSKTRKKIIGFKYDINNAITENDKSWHSANLQSVIFYDEDKKHDNSAQFIFDTNGHVICYQLNDKVYTNFSNENILIDMNNVNLNSDDSLFKTVTKSVKKAVNTSFAMIMWFIKGDN